MPADAHAGIVTALALDEDHADYVGDQPSGQEYLNGHSDVPVTLLPQRNPGASGISDVPTSLAPPAVEQAQEWPAEQEWPADSMPAQTVEPAAWEEPAAPQPSDTSAFFASRAHAASNGAPGPAPDPAPEQQTPEQAEEAPQPQAQPEPTRQAVQEASETAGADDAIYQKMLSEWLVDPHDLADSTDLNWESVWDHGWSAAAAAEDAPVQQHTEAGLPVREPGARLVPGAVNAAAEGHSNGGHHRNGGAHRNDDAPRNADDDEVASAAEFDTGAQATSLRDPEAVRASISNHFGGVHAGRSHARETRGTDNE
jgi:hypothetical protein